MAASTASPAPTTAPSTDDITSEPWYLADDELEKLDLSGPLGEPDMSLPPSLNELHNKSPTEFLGALRNHWEIYRDECASSKLIVEDLRSKLFPCKGGQSFPLSKTYLPLPDIERQHACFSVRGSFPILELPVKLEESSWRKDWGFLVDSLGVRAFDDIDFYLRLLQSWKDTHSPGQIVGNTSIPRLYAKLLERCNESMNKQAAKVKVRDFVEKNKLVFVPTPTDGSDPYWTHPLSCAWESKSPLKSRQPLEKVYLKSYHAPGMKELAEFFTVVLGLENITLAQLLDELKQVREMYSSDDEWINDLYEDIKNTFHYSSSEEKNDFLAKFSEEPLIFIETTAGPVWKKPSECIWTGVAYSGDMLRDRFSISPLYAADFEDFFLQDIGVERVTCAMVCDEIREQLQAMPSPPPVEGVKELIWQVNDIVGMDSMLSAGEEADDFQMLPVRHSGATPEDTKVQIETVGATFTIHDRKDLKALGRRAKWLDFTFEEVEKLEPFIWWLGLGDRRLSSLIRKSVTVGTDSEVTVTRNRDRNIAPKAHALLRIATHFASPRSVDDKKGLYRTLCNAVVYEASNINLRYAFSQEGSEYKIIARNNGVLLEEVIGPTPALKITVPKDAEKQHLCFFSYLPRDMHHWLMATPKNPKPYENVKALQVLGLVLNAPASIAHWILDGEGIISVNLPTDEVVQPAQPPQTAQPSQTAQPAVPPQPTEPSTPASKESSASPPSASNSPAPRGQSLSPFGGARRILPLRSRRISSHPPSQQPPVQQPPAQ